MTNNGSQISNLGLVAGPVMGVGSLLLFDLEPGHPEVSRTAGVALWMAIWWMTEAVPLAVTALLPVVLFPLLGVMDGRAVSSQYFNHIIFLFIGGFMVALSMQRWNLHRRIALRVLLLFGGCPRCTLTGFMLSTAFLSMWISNTATTMMMVPIVLAIVLKMEEQSGKEAVSRYATALFLGVAYGASIGGVATLVGTPPNLSFARILTIRFPNAPEISFATWFLFAIPISVLLLGVACLVLCLMFGVRGREESDLDLGVIREQYEALGRLSFEEKVVLADFVALALLWLSRRGLKIGDVSLPGWSALFEWDSFLNDGTVAMGMALILFLIPAREKGRIMEWETASRLPWHIVLLFGGGFALATGFKESGLSVWFAHRLEGLSGVHPVLLVGAVCLLITFLTELTSNTATAEMFLPIMAALAVAVKLNPLLLMIPATLSCSFAFMLPVATPPNAIVFGTDRVRMGEMVRVGVVLNLIGAILVTAGIYVFGGTVLGIDASVMPDWARLE